MRQILHIDMDAFFAAIEVRNRPELKGKPVIVGGRSGSRGVVTTASYEARVYGVHSAMPMAQALRLCPHGIYIKPSKGIYKAESEVIMDIFRSYTPLVEALSIDEAFLDITGCNRLFGNAEKLARDIQERVQRERQLTCSIGISTNKFLAKLASDMHKPQGLTIIRPEDLQSLVWPLPVSRMLGVGPTAQRKMKRLGIHTIGDLAAQSPLTMAEAFGKKGPEMLERARGQDNRPVIPHEPIKSVGHETTFPTDVSERTYLETALMSLLEDVCRRLRKYRVLGRTITIKMRSADFKTITRSRSFDEASQDFERLWPSARELFFQHYKGQPLRLIGVTVSKLISEEEHVRQPSLFENLPVEREEATLDHILDDLQQRFGSDKIGRARTLGYRQEGEMHAEEDHTGD